jgi:hypothetical protein
VRVPDPLSGDVVTMAETQGGMPYDEAYAERKLAQVFQQLAERQAEPAARATPHASLPPGRHLPALRRTPRYGRPTARQVSECKSPRCRRVMVALRDGGPLTRQELARATLLPEGSVNGRCDELLSAGYVIATGETRPTQHGGTAGVLALNPDKPYPF